MLRSKVSTLKRRILDDGTVENEEWKGLHAGLVFVVVHDRMAHQHWREVLEKDGLRANRQRRGLVLKRETQCGAVAFKGLRALGRLGRDSRHSALAVGENLYAGFDLLTGHGEGDLFFDGSIHSPFVG